MGVDEYLELCAKNDVPEEEARQLLGDLHRVGFLLYFDDGTAPDEGDPLSHVIFLRPEEIADKLYDELQLVSPTQRYVEELAQQKQVGRDVVYASVSDYVILEIPDTLRAFNRLISRALRRTLPL